MTIHVKMLSRVSRTSRIVIKEHEDISVLPDCGDEAEPLPPAPGGQRTSLGQGGSGLCRSGSQQSPLWGRGR